MTGIGWTARQLNPSLPVPSPREAAKPLSIKPRLSNYQSELLSCDQDQLFSVGHGHVSHQGRTKVAACRLQRNCALRREGGRARFSKENMDQGPMQQNTAAKFGNSSVSDETRGSASESPTFSDGNSSPKVLQAAVPPLRDSLASPEAWLSLCTTNCLGYASG